MKALKYILLFSFGLVLLGLLLKIVFHVRGGNESMILGVLLLTFLIPIYGIVALVKKQHRIEAGMMCFCINLMFGVLFKTMSWPGASEMTIAGSLFLFFGSVAFLIYALIKKIKLPLAILFVVIGFCSLAYCFKVLFWPGAKELIIMSFIIIVAALIFIFRKSPKLTTGIIVSNIIILLFVLSFVTKESSLYRITKLDMSNPESNHPHDYYDYAWVLNMEGDFKNAKINLQSAIDNLNTPKNDHPERIIQTRESYLKTFQKAMDLLNDQKWEVYESPYFMPSN